MYPTIHSQIGGFVLSSAQVSHIIEEFIHVRHYYEHYEQWMKSE